ncbi:PHP domain-containing protein [Stenoxybacter acetivorans]|uniref:PHP domain-containing protein n=1 Tax=Stenoxybacter acetivorans TaxID=422441 RepID=UPI000567766A|nr:PHP domain-containing protein [Stenoxybacter acetivorans]
MNIDLHCHSNVSDGVLSPAEVVAKAADNGCTLLALTDHDHTGGLAEARSAAQSSGIHFINGVEISVSWRAQTIHIVGLNFDEQNSALQKLLAHTRQGRLLRLRAIADKLAKKGIDNVFDGALSLTANPEMVGRAHIAQFLLDQGIVRNKETAFRRYLGQGKCAYVQHQWAALADTVHTIIAADGIAVIAHPMRYGLSATAKRHLFTEFKAYGGKAIEVHSGNSDLNDRLNYARLAEQFGFQASAGSDFHRNDSYSGGKLGVCPELPAHCQPVWQNWIDTAAMKH